MNESIIYAVDIGGTKIDLGLISSRGHILQKKKISVSQSPNEAVRDLSINLQKLVEDEIGCDISYKNYIKAVGIGAPNVRGGPNGGYFEPVVVNLPEWKNFNLKRSLEDCFGVSVNIENDSDAATMGVFLFDNYDGLVEEERLPFLYLTVSTGTGGGLIISDNKQGWMLYRGYDDCHPEFGHIPFAGETTGKPNVKCGCNRENCLNSYISGRCIERRYGIKPENITHNIKNEVAYNLAEGLYTIGLFYGPKFISLGGGVIGGLGESFVNTVKKNLNIMYNRSPLMTQPEVRISGLGDNTGLLGAGAVALKYLGTISK